MTHIAEHDTLLVQTDRERDYWQAKGWATDPGGVKAAQEALERDRSTLEAHRNYEDRNMSAGAKTEIAAVRQAAQDFVPEVPETPIRRGPGRPPKVPVEP